MSATPSKKSPRGEQDLATFDVANLRPDERSALDAYEIFLEQMQTHDLTDVEKLTLTKLDPLHRIHRELRNAYDNQNSTPIAATSFNSIYEAVVAMDVDFHVDLEHSWSLKGQALSDGNLSQWAGKSLSGELCS